MIKKGQIIYKEGDTANYIYAIQSGQFIFTKNYKKTYDKSLKNRRNSISPRNITRRSSLDIVIKLPPAIFGFEDTWQDKNLRTTNCYCKEAG
mmetsp:Transcript_4237/g.566  ORF Transcript_4237/g.566 Transcript_4237/m.566 type:complete len:92 (-) Transcript_4237:505-780(-)